MQGLDPRMRGDDDGAKSFYINSDDLSVIPECCYRGSRYIRRAFPIKHTMQRLDPRLRGDDGEKRTPIRPVPCTSFNQFPLKPIQSPSPLRIASHLPVIPECCCRGSRYTRRAFPIKDTVQRLDPRLRGDDGGAKSFYINSDNRLPVIPEGCYRGSRYTRRTFPIRTPCKDWIHACAGMTGWGQSLFRLTATTTTFPSSPSVVIGDPGSQDGRSQ